MGETAGYLETVRLIQNAEHLIAQTVDCAMEAHDVGLTAAQALILFRLQDEEMTASEMKRTCYIGSNVSYNLKKLVEMGFLDHQRSRVDRRSVRIKATPKGLKIAGLVAALFARQAEVLTALGDLPEDDMAAFMRSLRRFHSFLFERIAYQQL